jgi:hypothetical protein
MHGPARRRRRNRSRQASHPAGGRRGRHAEYCDLLLLHPSIPIPSSLARFHAPQLFQPPAISRRNQTPSPHPPTPVRRATTSSSPLQKAVRQSSPAHIWSLPPRPGRSLQRRAALLLASSHICAEPLRSQPAALAHPHLSGRPSLRRHLLALLLPAATRPALSFLPVARRLAEKLHSATNNLGAAHRRPCAKPRCSFKSGKTLLPASIAVSSLLPLLDAWQ